MSRLPARFEHPLFALLLSGLMSFLVSGVATWKTIGLHEGFTGHWLSAWLSSWLVAFPTVMVLAPMVRKFVAHLIAENN